MALISKHRFFKLLTMRNPFVVFRFTPLVFMLYIVAAEAAPMAVYEGILGTKTEVVMELSASAADGMRTGRYFYRRHGVDIPLRGTPLLMAEGLPLSDIEEAADADEIDTSEEGVFEDPVTHKPRVVWSGRVERGRYVGTWRDVKTGKSLRFNLKHIATYDPEKTRSVGVEAVTDAIVQGVGSNIASDVGISMTDTPYDFLRVQVPMTNEKEIVQGKVAYRLVSDPRTRVAYPRLTRHPDSEILTKTNRLLEQRHWAMNLDALACASSLYFDRGPAAGSLGGYDREDIAVEYLSPTLMSVVESGSTYCGGAHPNNHYEPYTLDLLRGGYFDFAQILKGYEHGEYTPRYSEEFLSFLRDTVQRTRETVARDGTDCSDIWPEYLYLHFTAPNELSFDVSGIGHAMGVCLGPHLNLPFGAIKQILKPDSTRYLGVVP